MDHQRGIGLWEIKFESITNNHTDITISRDQMRVLSANRDQYEPWTIKSEMDFEVLGRVLKVWRSEYF